MSSVLMVCQWWSWGLGHLLSPSTGWGIFERLDVRMCTVFWGWVHLIFCLQIFLGDGSPGTQRELSPSSQTPDGMLRQAHNWSARGSRTRQTVPCPPPWTCVHLPSPTRPSLLSRILHLTHGVLKATPACGDLVCSPPPVRSSSWMRQEWSS